MKTQIYSRVWCVIATLAVLLAFGAQDIAAQPPAPAPAGTAKDLLVSIPTFSWQPSAGAYLPDGSRCISGACTLLPGYPATYEVEVGPQSDPNLVYLAAQTVNCTLTPVDARKLPNEPLYWRVRARNSLDAAGPWSARVKFYKSIPAPSPVPASASGTAPGSDPPTLAWKRPSMDGAAYYKVEVSAAANLLPVEATYTTYNLGVTPVSTLAHGTHYWRATAVDADGHLGAPSPVAKFTRGSAPPVLVKPDAGAAIPTLQWKAVNGSAYYKVELSANAAFAPVKATYTTCNLEITPVRALAPGIYYWRVSGADADGHEGVSSSRSFTLTAPPAATDPIPQLNAPGSGQKITATPTFIWTRSAGAKRYRLIVSKYADFRAAYDTVDTDYSSYTPYKVGAWEAYANGVYYWQVQARDADNKVIAVSEAHSFTLEQPLTLNGPAGGAALTRTPTFEWSPVVGARRYRLIVSKQADFRSTYDDLYSEYWRYTPYTPGSWDAYANGVYYWKVEAWSSGDAVIATSEVRSFTLQQPIQLSNPEDGAGLVAHDPDFEWTAIAGAHRYRLLVSKYADFRSLFDSVYTDYNRYTPYTAGTVNTYLAGTYYWKVEAWNSGDAVITTSGVRRFVKRL